MSGTASAPTRSRRLASFAAEVGCSDLPGEVVKDARIEVRRGRVATVPSMPLAEAG